MSALSPSQAAAIAKHVYAVRQESDLQSAYELSGGLGLKELFSLDGSKHLSGRSGVSVFRKQSGFGYAAHGVGQRQGEALLAFRGTATARDWATDANIGLQRGPGGWPVHAGFNDTFKTMREEINRHFSNTNPATVHCVGHSLGGALATLAADYLSENQVSNVLLYSFGSPRVGIGGFSGSLGRKLSADNIYRTYHTADPVSMIPIFPFAHTPPGGPDYRLEWNGGRVAVAAHFMDNYTASIGDVGWNGIRHRTDQVNWEQRAKKWLETSATDGVMMFSARVLWMIGSALRWVLRKIAIGAIGVTLTAGVTVLDQLAWMLHQGVAASREIAGYVASLIKAILRFLGRTISAAVSLTVAFIRWVMGLLFSTLQNVTTRALNLMPFG